MNVIELLESEWAGKPDGFVAWDDNVGIAYALDVIRDWRRLALKECDWTQLPDVTLSDAQVQAWTEYRQALRDLPQVFEATLLDTVLPHPPA